MPATPTASAALAIDFIGAGWSYPLGTDATGGVALVTGEERHQTPAQVAHHAPGQRGQQVGNRLQDQLAGPALAHRP